MTLKNDSAMRIKCEPTHIPISKQFVQNVRHISDRITEINWVVTDIRPIYFLFC